MYTETERELPICILLYLIWYVAAFLPSSFSLCSNLPETISRSSSSLVGSPVCLPAGESGRDFKQEEKELLERKREKEGEKERERYSEDFSEGQENLLEK